MRQLLLIHLSLEVSLALLLGCSQGLLVAALLFLQLLLKLMHPGMQGGAPSLQQWAQCLRPSTPQMVGSKPTHILSTQNMWNGPLTNAKTMQAIKL